MNELSHYTGIAYDFNSYNCWHHVMRVRADHGIFTPEFDCTSPDLSDDVFNAAHGNSKGMTQLSEPESYCAVLILIAGQWHSGVYLDGQVSHCDMEARQVRMDSLKSMQKICERIEFWH